MKSFYWDEVKLKLKMLRLYGICGIRDWYRVIWKQQADAQICCNGYMCGCYGADYFSYWEHMCKNPPEIVK